MMETLRRSHLDYITQTRERTQGERRGEKGRRKETRGEKGKMKERREGEKR
jgi:hypothetical protein